MKKALIISALGVAVVVGAVPFLDNDVKAQLQQAVGIHNDNTMADADKKAAKAQDAAIEAAKGAVESGKNVVAATSEAAKQIQSGDAAKGFDTLDRAGVDYMATVEKVQNACDAYSGRLDTLKEETDAENERWADIIATIKDPKMKADHQRMKDRRMRLLNRRLQAGKNTLQVLYAGLERASDAKLALASIQEDVRVGAIGTKLDAFITEMKDADTGLERALAAISSSLDTNNTEAATGL